MLFERLMLCSGMLSDRWPQTCPCEERVLHRPRCPNLRFLEFWVNLGESNPRRSHFVSGASLDVRSIDYPCGVGFAATGTFRSIVSLPTPPVKVSGVLPIARQKTISDRRAVSFQVERFIFSSAALPKSNPRFGSPHSLAIAAENDSTSPRI